MRLVIVMAGLLFTAYASNSAAQATAAEMFWLLEREVAGGENSVVKGWAAKAAGQAGFALLIANGMNIGRGQRPFFCQPADLNITPTEFSNLALADYRSNPASYRDVPAGMTIALGVYRGMLARYPCR